MKLAFTKMQGAGNDFVVLDCTRQPFDLDSSQLKKIADRHFGVGCDQVLVVERPRDPAADFRYRIFNADGSEVEACGNGMRCVGWTVAEATGRRALKFETKAGVLEVGVAGIGCITVDMGRPRFGWQDIPLARPVNDTMAVELRASPLDEAILHSPSVVNVGNPHAVFWVDDVEAYDLAALGPMLETHPIFPERANISLACVTSPTAIVLRTWERGAGLTRACGSAACAAAVASARLDRTGRAATVTLPGGDLAIDWRARDEHVLMTGPVAYEYEGRFDPALFAAAGAA